MEITMQSSNRITIYKYLQVWGDSHSSVVKNILKPKIPRPWRSFIDLWKTTATQRSLQSLTRQVEVDKNFLNFVTVTPELNEFDRQIPKMYMCVGESILDNCPLHPTISLQTNYNVVTLVMFCHICHILSHLSHFVTLDTFCHICQILSHLSCFVTLVMFCITCHTLSHMSHFVTLVMFCNTCHLLSHLSHFVIIVTLSYILPH